MYLDSSEKTDGKFLKFYSNPSWTSRSLKREEIARVICRVIKRVGGLLRDTRLNVRYYRNYRTRRYFCMQIRMPIGNKKGQPINTRALVFATLER